MRAIGRVHASHIPFATQQAVTFIANTRIYMHTIGWRTKKAMRERVSSRMEVESCFAPNDGTFWPQTSPFNPNPIVKILKKPMEHRTKKKYWRDAKRKIITKPKWESSKCVWLRHSDEKSSGLPSMAEQSRNNNIEPGDLKRVQNPPKWKINSERTKECPVVVCCALGRNRALISRKSSTNARFGEVRMPHSHSSFAEEGGPHVSIQQKTSKN